VRGSRPAARDERHHVRGNRPVDPSARLPPPAARYRAAAHRSSATESNAHARFRLARHDCNPPGIVDVPRADASPPLALCQRCSFVSSRRAVRLRMEIFGRSGPLSLCQSSVSCGVRLNRRPGGARSCRGAIAPLISRRCLAPVLHHPSRRAKPWLGTRTVGSQSIR